MTAEIEEGFNALAQGMRMVMGVLSLVLMSACACVPSNGNTTEARRHGVEEGPAEMRILASGTHTATSLTEPLTVLATDDATYRAKWDSLIGSGTIPPVDFENEVAVILLAGQRNTGGYSVVAESARVEGDELVVRAPVHSPGARAIVTQVITSPYVVVSVKARGVKSLRWEK